MNHVIRFFSRLMLLTTLYGCSNYYYSTTELNLSRVSERGDLKIAASKGAQSNLWGNERVGQRYFSVAGSPLRHLSLAGSHTRVKGRWEETPTLPPFGGGSLTDVALGGYYTFTKPEDNLAVMVDAYAGYGWGDFEMFYESGTSSAGRFQRSSLQLAVHLSYQEWISMDVGWRASRLDYRDLLFRNVVAEENLPLGFSYLSDNNPFRVNALGIRLQSGFPFAKTFLSYTFANAPQAPHFLFLNQTFNLGVMVEIDEFFRKRK